MKPIEPLKQESAPDFRAVYPDLSDKELFEVKQRLSDYVALVISFYEYLKSDPEAYARFKALTTSRHRSTIRSPKVESSSN
jgi:hypothetical protein